MLHPVVTDWLVILLGGTIRFALVAYDLHMKRLYIQWEYVITFNPLLPDRTQLSILLCLITDANDDFTYCQSGNSSSTRVNKLSQKPSINPSHGTLVYSTLSNARRFYLSSGNSSFTKAFLNYIVRMASRLRETFGALSLRFCENSGLWENCRLHIDGPQYTQHTTIYSIYYNTYPIYLCVVLLATE